MTRIVPTGAIPEEILGWIEAVFRACNRRVTRKIEAVPNAPEPSLDLTWIEHLSRYSAPVQFPTGWRIRIEAHYLGGLRHWKQWEIADIGLIVRYRVPEGVLFRKVGLLQSKRLLPRNTQIAEETRSDFEAGFSRLDDPEDGRRSLGFAREFHFDQSSVYGEIEYQSEQVNSITEYEQDSNLTVFYQLYNPWKVPWVGRIPRESLRLPAGNPGIGVRVVPARSLHRILGPSKRHPRLADLDLLPRVPRYGWRLETWVRDLVRCQRGDRIDDERDERLTNLYFRRSGPIAAAISITVEAPDQSFADALGAMQRPEDK